MKDGLIKKMQPYKFKSKNIIFEKGGWPNFFKYARLPKKSQHGCVRWALREHLPPPLKKVME